ncbi:nucleotidyl transferase AbiEii/AbiGii toxin family protein [Streptomyces sp. GC420]|uniref:nucleotidyl transferase AbiEii/AbiGii toxin family protein n=1 Tax=Streptomyces sp. GC420 TaxID=2697568 RepID=UPI001414EEC3|nr:nucleotidyl transferase AbiEii/AbiGii toxin family protein [Streptomyces sp. GC420]NBM15713.1 hypothetical protein [Streptomyces sp. GC420]
MIFDSVQRRLLGDVLDLGRDHGLAVTGGHAVRAHGLVDRAGPDLDFATESPVPMGELAVSLRDGLAARGRRAEVLEVVPLMARLRVTEEPGGEPVEVRVMKEVLWRPPVQTGIGPVLDLEDLVGTKVRALADRGLARDVAAVYAARDRFGRGDLERLGARHDEAFDLRDLNGRLERLEWVDDGAFRACGLDDEEIGRLRAWAADWQQDIAERLAEPYDEGAESDEEPDGAEEPEG